jgi:hypothetical protein
MIATIFSKSNPFNYVLITVLLIICFLVLQLQNTDWLNDMLLFTGKAGILLLLIASLFISNFVTKRNGLSKDSTFPFLFFFAFLILFPTTLNNPTLVISNFFILLALRRLISLQSLLTPKEKIFDASIWIFTASIFHFWSILFIILVFVSILLHVSRDYRNWLLPYIAFFGTVVIFVCVAFAFDESLLDYVVDRASINLTFDYFTNKYQNIALSIYAALAILFAVSQAFALPNKPLILHASYKKVILAFIIGAAIYIISPYKNNSILIYTFMPLAVMSTSYIENLQVKWIQETTTILIMGLCLLSYILQL